MDIQGYIVDHWLERMDAEHPVLAIYDPEGRYAELLPLAEEKGVKVIDTTQNFLHARLAASRYWRENLSLNGQERMIVYRKRRIPNNKREQVEEPFSCFIAGGYIFPNGPKDEFRNLCNAFLPSKQKEVEDLFAIGSPSFNTINALLDGAAYPELEQLTGGKSFAEMIVGLLAQNECANMKWLSEWKKFTEIHFPGLNADGSSLQDIQARLWSYLLFSEFVFDLPDSIPDALKSVPMAKEASKENVYLICDKLRNQKNLRETYVRMANKTTQALHLDELFAKAKHLGERVTFSFENHVEYARFIEHLKKGELELAENILRKNQQDVWCEEDKEVSTFWQLAECVLTMCRCASQGVDYNNTLKGLVTWYTQKGYQTDEAFRRFHANLQNVITHTAYINELSEILNSRYRDYNERTVKAYQSHVLEAKDLPELKNQACIQIVYPALAEGKRVVYVTVDAMRYEMGLTFKRSIESRYKERIECNPHLSVFPAVTRFGMAAHLNDITTCVEEKKLQPVIDGKIVKLPDDRTAYLKERTNVEVQDIRLEDFNAAAINDTTRLLVIRSLAIDSSGENEKLNGLPTMERELVNLAKATEACRQKGFDLMVIAADHGFMLQPSFRAGDLIQKPVGSDVVLDESRVIVGSLNETEDTISFTPDELGVDAPVMKFCYAKDFTVFRKGEVYYHEGLSLQENVVPIITIRLQDKQKQHSFHVDLEYKGRKTGTIYTRRPFIDIKTTFDDFFADDVHIIMKITDEQGELIGSPEGRAYNEVTEQIDIPAGVTQLRQSFSINDEYNGSLVIVKALDANTLATISEIKLNFENEL